MSSTTKIIRVPHLGGTDVGYQMPRLYDNSKPTLILIHGFAMSSEAYAMHYKSEFLKDKMNLLGIDVIGHGATKTKNDTFTYWDTAIINIQLMDVLGIMKAFALGTSQGGWITARMALIAPDRIEGIIPIGSLMDYESEAAHNLGCWDGITGSNALIDAWTSTIPTPEFALDDQFCDFCIDIDFGKACDDETRTFWRKTIKDSYRGDEGRRTLRMAVISMRDRDGLHGRLEYVRCPVLWLHGTLDALIPVASAEKEIKLFTNSLDARLLIIEGGQHVLSYSHQHDVEQNVAEFVSKYHK
ncbi:hypothetical protein IFR05_007599 [Cadophora sp. M221]|nr:hypothetical protein IFR05_007599 [Cadophora sp. M221]